MGHIFRDSRCSFLDHTKKCFYFSMEVEVIPGKIMLYMLALVGQLSLRGRDACVVLRVRGASWRNCRQNLHKTSFFILFSFFC